MSLPTISRLLDTISSFEMIDDHDSLLIALSGGADSTALLVAMAEIAPTYNLRLSAVHVHHGIRGKEADRDAAHARAVTKVIAKRYAIEIPFYLHKADVKKIAREKKLSTQEAGRLVRDTFFRDLIEKTGATKIATGHTATDNAETFLMRLITGAGPEGLSGIPPVRLPYVRPLIDTTRAEVEAFLTRRGIPWIVDSSNLKNDYLRNRVRNRIMPALAAVNPAVERSLVEAVGAYRAAFVPIKAAAESFLEHGAATDCLPVANLALLPREVRSEVIKLFIFRSAPHLPRPLRLTGRHIAAVSDLATCAPHGQRSVTLPGGLSAERTYDALAIVPKKPAAGRPGSAGQGKPEMVLPLSGSVPFPAAKSVITATVIQADHTTDARSDRAPAPPTDGPCASFDLDCIPGPLIVRTRRPGDRVHLAGIGTKKLSDLFIDNKIPRHDRDEIPLLVSGDDILWVVGVRIDERFSVTSKTERILTVGFEEARI